MVLSAHPSLASVDGASWNALDHGPSPFLEWGFLQALERSGSVGGGSGWSPTYLLVHGDASCLNDGGAQPSSPDRGGLPEPARAGRVLLGGLAAFAKDHSYGEYIFDFQWARASMRVGIPYYPKLVVAVPATPATGKRILLHPGLSAEAREQVALRLITGVRELADELDVGSIHWLFTSADEQALLEREGFAPRSSFQFHWHNRAPGWPDFDAFLASLSSRKRKQIRKERARAQAAVDAIRFVPGDELSPAQIAALDRFYRRTTDLYGGSQYLRPGFFEALVEHLPERVRFLEVTRGGGPIAGALFLETDQALYGRYWGCTEDVEFLHFEASYYAGIERCIARGIPLFEAGAQGEHKLVRGFMPVICRSSHWLRHPGLDRGVRDFLREERRAVAQHVEQLAAYGPYRRESSQAAAPAEVGERERED
ncbi:GNAT family N-acetyltransferase [Nannocystaceae bacterium ST9]